MKRILIRSIILLIILLLTFSATAATYTTYITHTINYKTVNNALRTIQQARAGDEVRIIINSMGGETGSAIQVMQAMNRSKATIVVYVKSYAGSMAAYIMTYADKVYLNKDSKILFHVLSRNGIKCPIQNNSLICYGAINLLTSFNQKSVALMTKTEYNKMLRGQDIFLSAKELVQRSAKYNILGQPNDK